MKLIGVLVVKGESITIARWEKNIMAVNKRVYEYTPARETKVDCAIPNTFYIEWHKRKDGAVQELYLPLDQYNY